MNFYGAMLFLLELTRTAPLITVIITHYPVFSLRKKQTAQKSVAARIAAVISKSIVQNSTSQLFVFWAETIVHSRLQERREMQVMFESQQWHLQTATTNTHNVS